MALIFFRGANTALVVCVCGVLSLQGWWGVFCKGLLVGGQDCIFAVAAFVFTCSPGGRQIRSPDVIFAGRAGKQACGCDVEIRKKLLYGRGRAVLCVAVTRRLFVDFFCLCKRVWK